MIPNFWKMGWGPDNYIRSCTKQEYLFQRDPNLMERTTLCSEKDTRRPTEWDYQAQKNTTRMVCMSEERMLSAVQLGGRESKINGKEVNTKDHSEWRIKTWKPNKELASKSCSKLKTNEVSRYKTYSGL